MTAPSQPSLQELAASIDRSALPERPAELWQFARKETANQEGGRERRRDRRYSLITNVIVVPLDRKLRTVDQPFVALSSGMSVSGIRLIHTRPAPSDLLFLEIEGQPVRFLLSVVRSRPVGHCFEIAGKLLKDDVRNQKQVPPVFSPANSNAIVSPAVRTGDNAVSLPTTDELAQWAGVLAAAETLSAQCNGPSRHAAGRGSIRFGTPQHGSKVQRWTQG